MLTDFTYVWVIDTEFRSEDGERNIPVCLCALELKTGRRLEVFFNEVRPNPFDYAGSLFVCYQAAAEWKTFLALGWELPPKVLDLYYEYLRLINGVWRGNQCLRQMGARLIDALTEFNLDSLSLEEKEEERGYILANSYYPPEGQARILRYCWTDVDGTAALLAEMLPGIDLDQALHQGSYSRSVAWMEHNGLPVSPLYLEVESWRAELRLAIVREVEAQHGYAVFAIEGKKQPKPVFKRRAFNDLIRRMGLYDQWPKTPTGDCSTDDKKVLKPMSQLNPALGPLRQCKKTVHSLTLASSKIGSDGRNRAHLSPWGTVTGRNNPRARDFILGRPHWVRHLVAPTKGRAIVHADIVAAEAGIAADASGDPEFLRIYNSGLDQYIEYAVSSGALPPGSIRDKGNAEIEAVRSLYKLADLSIKYGVGPQTLATNLGIPFWQAEKMIASHKRVYATYWRWAEAQIEQAYRHGSICTQFGWPMAAERASHNTLLNFPQQAACAELLRLTCILAEERGMGPMLAAPHHDALYLECADEEAEQAKLDLVRCFHDAGEVVLSGKVQLRVDPGIIRYPNHYEDEDGKPIWDIVIAFLLKKSA